jgi:hypothetical protein
MLLAGLYLYMPAPEDNPISSENIELGRRLFSGRLSCIQSIF